MAELRIIPKMQLFISCRKLKDTDILSKSDPFVQFYEKTRDDQWQLSGVTEVIDNNLNPDFITHFEVDYLFEEHQYLKFKVYDSDDDKPVPHHKNFIGEVECELAAIVGSKGQQLIKTLKNKNKSTGNIILRCEQISENNSIVMLQFSGKDLEDNSGIFHSFQPFFYLSRAMETGGDQRVYMSEHIKGRNVTWKILEKSLKDLSNGDMARPVMFELFDHHSSGNHDFLASTEFSISKITEEGVKEFTLLNPKKRNKKGYKHSGIIRVNTCQLVPQYSLVDYIQGGCQISLSIAIDYTASNGIPSNPASLHFMNPNSMNQYEQALYAVSTILLNYDSDKLVPLYGFGGKINGVTSHCFNVNFNALDPSVAGIEGIMTSYRNSLRYVELSGPTLFSQFLNKVIADIESQHLNQMNQFYNVLLILTDGEIHDMGETIDAIVRASFLPISIVIVGIGNDHFTNMHRLDADDEPLIDSRRVKMARDIVQFVPFREVNNSPQRLAKEVLAEIPRELTNFFKIKNIVPNQRVVAPEYDYNRSYSIAVDQSGGIYGQNLPQNAPRNMPPGATYQSLPPQSGPYAQPPPKGGYYQSLPPQSGPYSQPPPNSYYQSLPPQGSPQTYAPPPQKSTYDYLPPE